MDIWVGTGVWAGWKITTDHIASKDGHPVLVDPDGEAYNPDEIVSFNDVMTASEAALKWDIGKSSVRNNALAGKFLMSEARLSEKNWLVTRKGMNRVFRKKFSMEIQKKKNPSPSLELRISEIENELKVLKEKFLSDEK